MKVAKYLAAILLLVALAYVFAIPKPPPLADSSNMEEAFEAPKPKSPEPIIQKAKLLAVGDILLHDRVYESYETSPGQFDFSPLLQDIAPYLHADFAFANQETNIGGYALGLSSYPDFNSPHEILRDLVGVGFNLFARANNHTLDKGEIGISEAQNYWDSFPDIAYAGSAPTPDRNAHNLLEKNGIKIALLAYTYGLNGRILSEEKSHLADVFTYDLAQADIEAAKQQADLVIVSMHWGEEYQSTPSELQHEQAQWLADLGVHLILGTHPHVLQPIETLTGSSGNTTLCAYSLGNFISGQIEFATNVGGLLTLDIVKTTHLGQRSIQLENIAFLPTYNYHDGNQYRLVPLEDEGYLDFLTALMGV